MIIDLSKESEWVSVRTVNYFETQVAIQYYCCEQGGRCKYLKRNREDYPDECGHPQFDGSPFGVKRLWAMFTNQEWCPGYVIEPKKAGEEQV